MRNGIPTLALGALTACVLILAACGGGGGTPSPLPPAGLSLDTDIAARGDTVVLSGTNLGSSGTVEVGGVAATDATWGTGKVTLQVPADAPGGPQQVKITTTGGSAAVDLFVGVDFPSGTLDELSALGLPRGTAVRLGAGTYSATAAEITLDNLSLYGRGKDVTTVDVGAAPNHLLYYADVGQRVAITGLTLRTDFTLFVTSPGVAPAAASAVRLDLNAPAGVLLEQLNALANERLSQVQSQAVNPETNLEFKDVNLRQVAGGGVIATVDITAGLVLYPGSVTLDGVSVIGTTTMFAAYAEDDVVVRNSQADVAFAALASFAGTVTIANSTLNSLGSGAVMAFGARGASVKGSTMTTEDGDVTVATLVPTVIAPLHADAVVTGNTFAARRADPTVTTGGKVDLSFGPGSALVADNKLTANDQVGVSPYGTMTTVRDNTLTIGQTGATLSLALLEAGDAPHIGFIGNKVTFVSTGSLVIEGGPSVAVEGNTFTGSSNTGAAAAVEQTDDNLIGIRMTGNVFKDFFQALVIEGDTNTFGGLTVAANGNTFDFVIDAAPKVALIQHLDSDGDLDIDISGNVWGTNTDATTVEGYVTVNTASITGTPVTLKVAPIGAP